MNKLLSTATLAITLFAPAMWAGQSESAGAGSWSGVIINASCSVDEAFAEAAKCTDGTATSSLALYDDTIRQVYSLEPQDPAKGHLGDSVTVQGNLIGGTLHVTSVQLFSEVGLRPGQPAPAFSALDQFGKTQSLDSLRGPKGTVLLFYRSADW